MSSSVEHTTQDLKVAKELGSRNKVESVLVKDRHHAPLLAVLQAAQFSPLKSIQTTLKQEQVHRERRSNEIEWHLKNARDSIRGKKDVKSLSEEVLLKLQDNYEVNTKMNTALTKGGFKPGAEAGKHTTWHVTNNKTSLIIPGAQEFVKQHFATTFIDNQIPKGFSFEYRPADITILGDNPDSIWGNPKGTFFTTAILTTSLIGYGRNQYQDLESINESVLIYTSPLPREFDLSSIDARVTIFSNAHTFDKTKSRFDAYSCVHGGYVFGGMRDSETVGPFEDCTSWTSKVTNCGIIYTSGELKAFCDKTMTDAKRANALDAVYTPKQIKDPQKDIEPGSLYWQPGHTALVLGFISDGADSQIVGAAFSRDIEKGIDGFGVQLFPIAKKEFLIFSAKGRAAEKHLVASTTALGNDSALRKNLKMI